MARDINLKATISAKDDASRVIDKVAEKVEDLEDAAGEIKIEADATEATRSIDDVLAKIDKLSGTGAAELLIASNATQIGNEIADLLVVLDRLDANDPKIDIVASEIRSLEGDLDRLATKAREVSDTPISLNTAPAVRGTRDLTDSARGANSALANMIGNSAQDVGALGGVAGSAGVAIGQMAEYAADAALGGEKLGSSLASMAKVAGPIAGLTAGVLLFQRAQERAAEATQNHQEQIEGFSEALRDGEDAVAQFREELEDTGKLEVRDWTGDMEDLTDELARSGITVDQFGAAVEGGEAAVRALADAAAQAGADTDDVRRIMITGVLAAEDYAAAQERAANVAEILGESTDEAAEANQRYVRSAQEIIDAEIRIALNQQERERRQQRVIDATENAERVHREHFAALENTAEAAEEAADAERELADAAREQADAITAATNARRAAADAQFAANEATRQFQEQLAAVTEEFGEAGQLSTDYAAAMERTALAAADVADAQLRIADETATANGVTLTAVERGDIWRDSMIEQAATAQGPLRDAIIGYIGDVEGIPDEKMTEIVAAVAAGDLETAQRLLDEASEKRTAEIQAEALTATADGTLKTFTSQRRSTTVDVVLGDTPSAQGIANKIGTVRVPVTAYVQSWPRITGIRNWGP